MIAVKSTSGKILLYAMIVTLIVAFGAIGSVLASELGARYTLMGFFLGSAFGTFIAVYESTIIGCITGMVIGLIVSPLAYYFIDLETACLAIFTLSIFGAIMGEPIAHFWQEAVDTNLETDEDNEQEDFDDKSEEEYS